MKLHSVIRLPNLRNVASVRNAARLFCFWFAFSSAIAHSMPADISIPGELAVTIDPPEAAAAGAQWSVEGGSFQISGAAMTNVPAGNNTVQFNSVPGWLKPDDLQVLVIGGKQATVNATYHPIPRFYFRSVPEPTARLGTTVEFQIQTDDPGDLENPGPNTPLQMTATPQPAGSLSFDQASGVFLYTPAASDRLPFTVRFTTAQGLAGTFQVTPQPNPTVEDSVIQYDRPLPDPESRDYIQISQIPNGPELFNDATAETYTVSISGPTLVFATNHPANLYRQFNGRLDLHELRLYADTVIIRSPLVLPQTTVTIHARELRFEGDGRIETTPRARARLPVGAVWEDNLFAGNDGDPGHPAGNVNVFVERFYSDDTTAKRFVLRGGTGGPAGDGRDGRNEGTIPFLSADWFKLMNRAGNPYCGTTEGSSVIVASEEFLSGRLQDSCGDQVTVKGENAVPSGRPGTGGPGGTLQSTLNLDAFAELAGGSPGAVGNNHVGGILTARQFLYVTTRTIIKNGEEISTTDEEEAPKEPGADALAPSGSVGSPGTFVIEANPAAWLHSFSVRSIVQYARDAYLNDHIFETRGLLGDYQELLRAHERVVAPEEELSDDEFSELVNLDQLQTEIGDLMFRLDANLDYFGNPAGWVPMLSFEANYLAFQNELNQSIPILYLAYWLNNAATNVRASLAATEQAKTSLETERTRMEATFNSAQAAIPGLKSKAEQIAFEIGSFQGQLTNRLNQLEQRARDNVEDRHKLPFWKKALGVLSVAADLVPVGQPTVGRIGAGIGLLAQVDPDKPLASAEALQPKAFSVMTNVNISVCFGSNSPPVTSTNAPGSKKARQDTLKQLTDCGKFLGGELKEIAGVFKEAQVDDKEVAAELDKLKANDSELADLTQQLSKLNTDKEQFANELSANLQLVGSFSSGLSENLVATEELEDRIAANINVLDHSALMHIKEMQRRAQDRLMQYQYLLAKSFQYRQLRPFTGSLQLTSLFTRFQQLIEASSSNVLSQEEFENLKGIFVDELREVVAQSLDNVNAPSRSLPKSYRLNASQLQELNETGQVLLDLRKLGLIDAGDENVRLADLRTRTLTAHPVGPVGSLALVRVNFKHMGISRLTSGGRTFLFRHYQTENVNPIVWNAIYDANTGQTVNSVLSAAEQSLIGVLLAEQPVPVTNVVFFSLPAADAQILLTKAVDTDNGTDFVIDDLLFEIQYDFNQTSGTVGELNVRVADNLTPTITVSRQDINGRQDGFGDFTRMFPSASAVTLEAPSTYGRFVFDHWEINGRTQENPNPAVSVLVAGEADSEAHYRLASAPTVLSPVHSAPGQVQFRFVSEPGADYVVEKTSSLSDPVWTPVATRFGDGTVMEIALPAGDGSPVFFRVRQSL